MADDMIQGTPDTGTPSQQNSAPTPPATEPTTVTVRVGDVEYRVPPDLAVKIAEWQRPPQSQTPPPPPQPPQQPDRDDWETLWFENPKQAVQKLEERIVNRVYQEYRAAEAQKAFWQDFYREHPDLERFDRVAKTTLNERFREWADLPIPVAKRELANAVRAELAMIAESYKSTAQSAKKAYAESGTGTLSAPPPPPQTAPKTLSALLSERRMKRLATKS